jgi:DNA-binding beta-propeller fold protein YncE
MTIDRNILRRGLLSLLAAIVASPNLASGIEAKRQQILLLQRDDPSSLLFVDLKAGRIETSLPLEKNAAYAVAHPSAPVVYVIHRGRREVFQAPTSQGRTGVRYIDGLSFKDRLMLGKSESDPSLLSVVDLARKAVVRTLIIGKGDSQFRFSKDGSRVFVFAQGDLMTTRQETAKPENAATVTVLNSRTHEVEVTHRLDTSGDEFHISEDGEKVFVFSSGTRWTGRGSGLRLLGIGSKRVPQSLAIFGGGASGLLKRHELSAFVENTALSTDQNRLILVGRYTEGDQKGQSVLQTVDLLSGGITEPHPIGREARRLFRFEGGVGLWLAGKQEMSLISEEGKPRDDRIALEWEDAGEDGKPEEIEGYPGRTRLLAGNKAAIQIQGRNGDIKKRVALADLGAKRIQTVIPIGKKGARIGRQVAGWAMAIGLTMVTGYATSTAGSPYTLFFYPRSSALTGVDTLVARSDGQFCYALDPASDDLTVIRVSDGEVEAHVPFESSLSLWAPPGSRYLFGLGEKEIEVLDTETNAKVHKVSLQSGSAGLTALDAAANELYVLGNKGLEVWSGMAGKPIGIVKGLGYKSAVQIVLPGVGGS